MILKPNHILQSVVKLNQFSQLTQQKSSKFVSGDTESKYLFSCRHPNITPADTEIDQISPAVT